MYIKKEMDIKQLCAEYWVSRVTVNKIIKEFASKKIHWNKIDQISLRHLKSSHKLIKVISEFHEGSNQPYVANDVMKFIRNKYRVSIPIHIIKDTMRRFLNLSFKKGKSKPIGIDYIKQFSTKSLFAVRLVKEINNFSVLINIDETLFSRATKSVYSWLEKGKEWTISNIWWSNSISLLTAIL